MFVERSGLRVDADLAAFIEERVLPGTGVERGAFWDGAAKLLTELAPENRALLARRDDMQAAIDDWHRTHRNTPHDGTAYEAFLRDIGYLVDSPDDFHISPGEMDDEVARLAGPQLVVPLLNRRFLINAANARWGSLYDALYGTDAIASPTASAAYDEDRGAQVIDWAKAFLDDAMPLVGTRWAALTSLDNLELVDPSQLVGISGRNRLFRHNGLHIEVVVDRDHPIGRADPAGICDVIVEAALTTICDLEDSVAAVDGADKLACYTNWLDLLRGEAAATFQKGTQSIRRTLSDDRPYTASDGTPFRLPGRSLLLVRNVGHLMTTPAVILPDGSEAFEGMLDGIVTALCGMHDLKGIGHFRNSRTGSIYIVKPKMHGPDEAAFTDRMFDRIEDMIGLPRHSIKVGLMDEERRTSANLSACIATLRHRIFFINTGFLDRTGDEIHTSMHAGPMVRKSAMKASAWLASYEDRNVQIGLACGFQGRAQIGKGMWAVPDRLGDMLREKVAQPLAGATTAWVHSPAAATLHATHYHRVDVHARQRERAAEPVAPLSALLTPPVDSAAAWSAEDIREELENNAQSLLGYVVRWIDQGIGCSKVPDIHDIGLMEDRATLRISSQHIANWLLHGVVTATEVDAALAAMARRVDEQNMGDPLYRPMVGREVDSLAYQAARALIFEGTAQPNGYTEPLLYAFRLRTKAAAG